MQPVVQNTGEMKNVPVTLLVIGGIADGRTEHSELFQDSGDGWDYKRGGYNGYRVLQWEHRKGSLRIGWGKGDGAGLQMIGAVEAMGIDTKPSEVLVDGRPAKFVYDQASGRLAIAISGTPGEILLKR
jgi:hypothetical protein